MAYDQRKVLLEEYSVKKRLPKKIPISSQTVRYEPKYHTLPFDMANTLRHIERKLQIETNTTK